MNIESIANGVAAQNQALVQQEVGVHAFRMALDAQATEGAQLVKMMNQSSGVGTAIDTQA